VGVPFSASVGVESPTEVPMFSFSWTSSLSSQKRRYAPHIPQHEFLLYRITSIYNGQF